MQNQELDQQWFNHYKAFFDALTLTPHQRRRHDNEQLGKRLRLIAVDLELSGNTDDARVLMLAAGALMGALDE